MNNVLLLLGALLVGILTALVAVPMAIDWNGYRGVFEEEASRLLGRDVRVGGAVAVRILPVPYVRFEKLRIADTASTGGDPLFRADSVTMRLSIAPLLRGVLEAQSVELKRPSLRLAVDAEGRGNWRSLSFKPGSLPFVPADVTLQSVGIEGGTLALYTAAGRELALFETVDGELSADGFEGPFKFKGTASWSGDKREIRFATAKPEADGSTHVRATVRLPANLNTYAFEGRVIDLKGRPRVDGELTAKLPIAGIQVGADKSAAAKPAVKPGEGESDAFELKAKVGGDLNGGKLSEIALSLEQTGDPQLITGDVTATWGDALRFDMGLASRSLNIDKLGAASSTGDPLETARNALNVILAALPAEAQTDARLKAERVTLGGEAVTGVSIAMNRRGPNLEVKELRAVLPGKTRLDASGAISRDGKEFSFAGPVALRGAALGRFLSWAQKDGAQRDAAAAEPAGAATEGPFALDGQLQLAGTSFALTRATAEIADQPMAGELRMTGGARRRIGLVLQGQKIDLAQVWPGGFDLNRLRTALTGTASGNAEAGKATAHRAGDIGFFGFNPETTDLKVDVKAADLQVSPTQAWRDVDAAFTVERGVLTFPRIKAQSASGLSIDLDGQLSGLSGTLAPAKIIADEVATAKPRGIVRFIVGAPATAAINDLMTYLDVPADQRPPDDTIAALGPVRLAGSMTVGATASGKPPAATELAVDGTVDGGHIVGAGRFDTGLSSWRTGGLDLTATIDAKALGKWLAFAGLADLHAGSQGGRPVFDKSGQLQVKAVGVPQTGLSAYASLTSDDLQIAYQGAATVAKGQPVALNGAASLVARDASDALALIGVSLGQGGTAVPLQGQVHVVRQDRTLSVAAADFGAATSLLSGSATFTDPGGADGAGARVRTVTADLSVDTVNGPGLLALFADRRQASADATSGDGGRAAWPDQPLTFAGLDTLSGSIQLSAGRVLIDGAAALTNAKARITLAPGLIAVDDLTGRSGLGGAVAAKFALQKSSAGAVLKGEGSVEGDRLAVSHSGGVPLAVKASFGADGLSPSGLIAALKGQGEALVGPGQMRGVAASGVAGVVDAALAAAAPLEGDALTVAVRDGLAASSLLLGARRIAFTLADGQVRLPATVFQTPEGRSTFDGAIDLARLRFTSEWRIEAAAKPGVTGKPKGSLPAVVVSAAGSIANLGEADSKLSLSAFEQELVLRKLERDAEELERIRKLDEERRAKEDAERARLAAEAQAAAARAAAATGAGVTGAGVTVAPEPGAAPPAAAQTPVIAPEGTEPAKAAAAPASVAAPARQPAPANRRRAQEGIPQPLQQNF